MRRAALFVLLCLLAPSIGIAAGGADAPDEGSDAWRAKADPVLLASYDAGATEFRLMLQGPPIPAPAQALGDDRAAWRAHWARHAEPFFGAVRGLATETDAAMRLEVAAGNIAFVGAARDAVPLLIGFDGVRRAALDWDGAMFLVDGAAPDGDPGVQVTLGEGMALIQAQQLWSLGYRGEGVKVAVLDTGVRHTHEMMKNADGTTRVSLWKDFAGSCANPCDGNGHGTHTTTTAVGSNLFNPSSPSGVAPRATVMHAKVLSDGGSGNWEWGQEGLQWAFDNGADLTSNSWGGDCAGGATTAELAEALQDAGMLSVFAAGNDGPGASSVDCPGMADKVLTVGSLDINENVSGFSGRGPCEWDGVWRICPDVMAMGSSLVAGWSTSDTAYASVSGTSMSTPQIAGLAALLQQASKELRGRGLSAPGREAEVLMRWTAKDLGTAGPDNNYGWGLAKGLVANGILASPAPVDFRTVAFATHPLTRQADVNILTFAVANLGAVTASAHQIHRADQVSFGACPPACEAFVVNDRSVAMPPVREAFSSGGFDGGQHVPGDYNVTARLEYTYIDPLTGLPVSATIEHPDSFLLKRVYWVSARPTPSQVTSGQLVPAGIDLLNAGNDDAGSLRYQENTPLRGFVPAPPVPPGMGQYGSFANPSPTTVSVDTSLSDPRLRYEWNLGTLPPGDQWDASFNLVAGQAGTYRLVGKVSWVDSGGLAYTESYLLSVAIASP